MLFGTDVVVPVVSAIIPMLLGGFVHLWVKTNVNATEIKGVKELINARFDLLEENQRLREEEASRRLDRIERSMNGHLVKE